MQFIEDITNNCETVFTDLAVNFPVFYVSNSLRILEVIEEIFMDIPNLEESWSFLNLHSVHEIPIVNTRIHELFDFDNIDLGVENDSESELLEV